MAKKPVKKKSKSSNKSTVSKKKPNKSGPCGGESPRNHRGPSKLKP